MSKLSIISNDFVDGGEIPKECGYKHGNEKPHIDFIPGETEPFPWAMIMDDPDAMKAVGKVWVHWLEYGVTWGSNSFTSGKNDFGEIGYGGPAPPDGRHTYVFKLSLLYAVLRIYHRVKILPDAPKLLTRCIFYMCPASCTSYMQDTFLTETALIPTSLFGLFSCKLEGSLIFFSGFLDGF
jgi:hypothetical protein